MMRLLIDFLAFLFMPFASFSCLVAHLRHPLPQRMANEEGGEEAVPHLSQGHQHAEGDHLVKKGVIKSLGVHTGLVRISRISNCMAAAAASQSFPSSKNAACRAFTGSLFPQRTTCHRPERSQAVHMEAWPSGTGTGFGALASSGAGVCASPVKSAFFLASFSSKMRMSSTGHARNTTSL